MVLSLVLRSETKKNPSNLKIKDYFQHNDRSSRGVIFFKKSPFPNFILNHHSEAVPDENKFTGSAVNQYFPESAIWTNAMSISPPHHSLSETYMCKGNHMDIIMVSK